MHYGIEHEMHKSFHILVGRCAILKQLVIHTASSLDGRERDKGRIDSLLRENPREIKWQETRHVPRDMRSV